MPEASNGSDATEHTSVGDAVSNVPAPGLGETGVIERGLSRKDDQATRVIEIKCGCEMDELH